MNQKDKDMVKVINPNVEIWHQEGYNLEAIWKQIARCARVCYQSVPKDNDETDYGFVVRTILRGADIINHPNISIDCEALHLSVCEHGTVHLKFPSFMPRAAAMWEAVYKNNKYSKTNKHEGYLYVTTNMRVVIENKAVDTLEFIDATPNCPYYINRVTVNFVTNIGVSRELNRHRVNSICEESTRYCSYDKGKFGNSITVTKVPWIDWEASLDNEGNSYKTKVRSNYDIYNDEFMTILPQDTVGWTAVDWYLYSIAIANLTYCKLRELGWQAQQARDILPLATKTQVVHTAFIGDWEHWIKLRSGECSGKVHPEMRELAAKLVELVYPK